MQDATLARKYTKAAAALAAACRPRMPQSKVAKRLQVSRATVRAWSRGELHPDAEQMRELEALLGIPFADWAEDAAPPPESDATLADDDA